MGATRTRPPFNTQDQSREDTVTQSFVQDIDTGKAGGYSTGNE